MLPANTPFDLTGTVRLDSAVAVANAISRLLAECFPAEQLNAVFLRRCFEDIEAAFWGEYPGYLHCDTPYHDLRHSLDTALLAARMAHGYQQIHRGTPAGLSGAEAELLTLFGLFHDIGFLRRDDEGHLRGAQLVIGHEERSVAFARRYLAATPLAAGVELAGLIRITCLGYDPAEILGGLSAPHAAMARMVGSADLISQVSDRCYLERCRDYLYQELNVAGIDRVRDANGQEKMLYLDGEDLLRKTPEFYEQLVRKRLEQDYGNIQQVLEQHFGAAHNPYARSMAFNQRYLHQLIADNRLSDGLRRQPPVLLPGIGQP